METDITPATEIADSVVSTNEIAAEVYDDHESDAAASAAIVDKAEPAPQAAAETLTPSEAEQMLREHGFVEERRPDGREHRIPRSKVLKMIESGLRKGREADTQKWQTTEQRLKDYERDWAEFARDISGDPWDYVSKLALHDPRYKAILDLRNGTRQPEQSQDEPEPKLVLDQGNDAYLKSVADRDAWLERKWERKLDQRLKPLTEREEREKFNAVERQRQEASRRQMDEAATWPGFGPWAPDGSLNPFQQEVLQEMKAARERAAAAGDHSFRPSIRHAYLEVQNRKLAIEDSARREAILKELNTAPKSTAVVKSGGSTPSAKQGQQTIRDIAASTYDAG